MFQSHHQWLLPPTIGIRAPFVRKQKCFGIYLNFQSCQKQMLIIPQCRAPPYELTGAKNSLIGARGEQHAPPEDPVIVAHAQPLALEVDDECRPRAPYSSRAEPFKPLSSRAVSRVQPSRTSAPSRADPAASAPKEYSLEYSANIPQNIPGSTQRTARRTELVFGPVHPFFDPISRK